MPGVPVDAPVVEVVEDEAGLRGLRVAFLG